MWKLIRRAALFLVATALAGLAGTTLGRRRRHGGQAIPVPVRPTRAPAATQMPQEAVDTETPEPPLSPARFTASHFGLLIVLLAVAGGGLMWRGIRRYPPESTWHVVGGDVEQGRAAIIAYGCAGCHSIAGIPSATGRVGPPLEGFAHRMYIGGQLPNDPESLIAWLQDPQQFAPGTAMPDLGVSATEARDMAAFLYSNP